MEEVKSVQRDIEGVKQAARNKAKQEQKIDECSLRDGLYKMYHQLTKFINANKPHPYFKWSVPRIRGRVVGTSRSCRVSLGIIRVVRQCIEGGSDRRCRCISGLDSGAHALWDTASCRCVGKGDAPCSLLQAGK